MLGAEPTGINRGKASVCTGDAPETVQLIMRVTRCPPFRPRAQITLAQHEVLHRTCGRGLTPAHPIASIRGANLDDAIAALCVKQCSWCALLRFHSTQLACRAVVERRWRLT